MSIMINSNLQTGESNQISLLDTNGGVVKELIEHEFASVLKNIMDLNTDAKSKRNITLKFTFVPYADRSMMSTQISVNSKLAPVQPVDFNLLIGGTEKEPMAIEMSNEVPGQTAFDGSETDEQKVIKLSAMA